MKQAITLAFLLLAFQNVSAQRPTAGLVAWYPFNGSAADATGNGNNGTVNGATLTTDRFGNSASAYLFNGTSDNISGSTVTYPIGNSARNISAWFNTRSLPGAN